MDKFFKLNDCDYEKEKKYNLLNSVFKKAKAINNQLLEKSNANDIHESTTILEAMLFYISSFSLSFLNNIYLNNNNSLGQKLNMRCILEGISVYYYLSGINDKQLLDMFRKQSFIFEWKIYKKYPSFNKVLFYLEQIEFNYKNTMEEYKQNYEINGAQFKKLLSFHIPFINMKTTFPELVNEMLGEELGILYKQLSLLIHPHDYSLDYDIKELINTSEYIIFALIENFFLKYKSTGDVGLEEEYQLVLGNNVTGTALRELITLQRELIYKVARVTYEKKLVGFSIILQEFVPLLFDFMLDIMYGYTEHGTTKIKPLMEMLALLDRTIEPKELRCNFDLMKYHGRIAFFNNIDSSKESEYIDNAYDSYREKYRNGIDKSEFRGNFFSTLGYLIDSKGSVPSLSFIVTTFIKKYSPNIMDNKIGDTDKELALDLYMKMKYEESQILSHANGYMYFTTTGTWVDGINILLFMDDYLNAILENFLTEYKNENNRDKTIVNVIRNYLRDVKDIIIKKRYFMSTPKINKYF